MRQGDAHYGVDTDCRWCFMSSPLLPAAQIDSGAHHRRYVEKGKHEELFVLSFLPLAEDVGVSAGAVKGNDTDFGVLLIK